MANLYIVSTPIGNLEDITYRAVRILSSVELILCEDTRVTSKLCEHYHVETKRQSYHANSTLQKTDYILNILREGKDIALVSDAGTPIISDPGIQLVQKALSELGDDVRIIPIPGASALLSSIVASGINCSSFTFLGFIPHKKGRETMFKEVEASDIATVMYESPHRIMKTLESLSHVLGESRTIAIARELTKMYEEVYRGNSSGALEYFTMNPDKVRGEFVVIVSGK